jgi:hypothetical protein
MTRANLEARILWHCRLSRAACERKELIRAIHEIDKARELWRERQDRKL